MRPVKLLIAALALALGLLFAEAAADSYKIDAVFLPESSALHVSVELEYTNSTGECLDHVTFALPANCFRRISALPYGGDTLTKAFPWGYTPAGVQLERVEFDSSPARYSFLQGGDVYFSVTAALEPGQTGTFRFVYTLLLSDNRAFLGCGDDVRLKLFYPVACPFRGGEAVTYPLSVCVHDVFALPAEHSLTLRVPKNYFAACGGDVTRSVLGDMAVYSAKLKDAGPLGLVLSKRFYEYADESALGTGISVYGNSRARCRQALKLAKDALNVYENWFGKAPWDIAIAFSSDALSSASPGLIQLGGDADEPESVVFRLLAQQFFGLGALTDPYTDPFLREGTAYYAYLLAQEELKGENAFVKLLNENVLPALKYTIPGSVTPDSFLTRFQSLDEFEAVTRLRGAAVMHEMRVLLGRDAFIRALKEFYQSGRGRLNTIEDFVSVLDGEFPGGAGSALISYLYTIDEYALFDGEYR